MQAAGISSTRGAASRGSGPRFADPLLQGVLAAIAAGVLLLIGFFFVRLLVESKPAFDHTGLADFVLSNDWVPSRDKFGALPLVFGTLVTSGIALLIGVPVAVASALYITELSPRALRTPLTILVELLAAVPSVVYGLWGIFFLAPTLLPAEKWFASAFSFVPFVGARKKMPHRP